MQITLRRALKLSSEVWWSVGYSKGNRGGYPWTIDISSGTKDIIDKIKRKDDNN